MHQRRLNHARLTFSLVPRGPILIKSGLETPDPTRPGMEFVRTRHPAVGETIYLPGTSLKGAFRSHAERVLRGLSVEVCDPLARDHGPTMPWNCTPRRRGRQGVPDEATASVHSRHCPTCRTFGSLGMAGRCSVQDAYPWPSDATDDARRESAAKANATERRTQVGISRANGAVASGTLFDLEVAVAGEFCSELRLDNFQLWQLGLLAAVLDDVNAGDVPIGFGKSRGLGQVGVTLHRLDCEWTGASDKRLDGAGALSAAPERRAYGLYEDDTVRLPDGCAPQTTWCGRRLAVAGTPLTALLDAVRAAPLTTFIERAAAQARRR